MHQRVARAINFTIDPEVKGCFTINIKLHKYNHLDYKQETTKENLPSLETKI